jgi:hypothetical protein
VQEVRRDEGLEPWPRFLERDVDVSDDEVFDLSLDGLDRFSDSVRWESILTGQGDATASTVGLSVLRRRDGAVLLRTNGGGSLCACRRKDSWNPLSMRFIVDP